MTMSSYETMSLLRHQRPRSLDHRGRHAIHARDDRLQRFAGCRLEHELSEEMHPLLREPGGGAAALERGPGPDFSLRLAALHGEVDVSRALVADHDLELGANERIEDGWEQPGVGRERCAAKDDFLARGVRDAADLCVSGPDCRDRRLLR